MLHEIDEILRATADQVRELGEGSSKIFFFIMKFCNRHLSIHRPQPASEWLALHWVRPTTLELLVVLPSINNRIKLS